MGEGPRAKGVCPECDRTISGRAVGPEPDRADRRFVALTPHNRQPDARRPVVCLSRGGRRVVDRIREPQERPVIITPLHEDGTGCAHPGLPSMAGPHGPAVCPAGIRVTRLRVADGQVWDLGAAVSEVQQVGQLLAAVLTPLLAEVARWAGGLTTDPGFQAVAAAAAVLDAARLGHAAAEPCGVADTGPQPAGVERAVDPCGDGPMPGQALLPF